MAPMARERIPQTDSLVHKDKRFGEIARHARSARAAFTKVLGVNTGINFEMQARPQMLDSMDAVCPDLRDLEIPTAVRLHRLEENFYLHLDSGNIAFDCQLTTSDAGITTFRRLGNERLAIAPIDKIDQKVSRYRLMADLAKFVANHKPSLPPPQGGERVTPAAA